MSENYTAYSPILSLIMKSLAYGMTQTCERLRPLPEVSNIVNPLSIPSLWAMDVSWNISVSVVISLLLVLPENSINNGKLESLRPCGVRYWWLSGESCEMVQRREGEAQTRLCAESSWGQLLLPLRDVFTFETVPFVRLSPKSQLSCSPSHTVSALAGTCEALRLAYGADRRKNIRPARSKQCVPSWQAPFLAKEEEEMWP